LASETEIKASELFQEGRLENPGGLSESRIKGIERYGAAAHTYARNLKVLAATFGLAPSALAPSGQAPAETPSEMRTDQVFPSSPAADMRLPLPAGKGFVGRTKELEELDAAWNDPRLRILSVVAGGGVGKSYLVQHWLERKRADWRDGGVWRFGRTFYRHDPLEPGMADEILLDGFRFFSATDPTEGNGSPFDRGIRLARIAGRQPTLFVLDGLEMVQDSLDSTRYPPAAKLKDHAIRGVLEGIAEWERGLCVITTRYRIAELEHHENSGICRCLELDHLTESDAADLLAGYELRATRDELLLAANEFRGHALTLNLLGAYVTEHWQGQLIRCLETEEQHPGQRLRPDATLLQTETGRRMARVLAWYDKQLRNVELAVLRLLTLFDRAVRPEELRSLLARPAIPGLTASLPTFGAAKWNAAVRRLQIQQLLVEESDWGLDTHPLVRDYFRGRFQGRSSQAGKRAGHARLFDYFRKNATSRPTVALDLLPLYQAVTHGCQAGRFAEAYRILREQVFGDDTLLQTRRFGLAGAEFAVLYHFFTVPWSAVTPRLSRTEAALVLRQTGYCLRSQGRLDEAVGCFQKAIDNYQSRKEWPKAAIAAGLLSQTLMTLGQLDGAVAAGKQAVQFADRGDVSPDHFKQRTALAYMLTQRGDRAQAGELFTEANEILQAMSPARDEHHRHAELLSRFHYADYLASGTPDEVRNVPALIIGALQPYSDLETVPMLFALAIGLNRYILGQALVRAAEMSGKLPPPQAFTLLSAAVDDIRGVGREDCLPLVLLARANCERLRGDRAAAERSVQVAMAVIDRSAAGLYRADAALARCRLFLAAYQETRKPAEREAADKELQAAKNQISAMGYFRRLAEADSLTNQLSDLRNKMGPSEKQ